MPRLVKLLRSRLIPAALGCLSIATLSPHMAHAVAITQETGGIVVLEAEDAFSITAGTNGDSFQILDSGASNFRGDGYLQMLPDNGGGNGAPFDGVGGIAEYKVNFDSTGTYRLWHRATGSDGTADSFYVRVFKDTPGDFYLADVANNSSNFNGKWDDQGRLNTTSLGGTSPIDISIASTGVYTVQIAEREDGVRVDSLLLDRTGSFTGSDPGPAASAAPEHLMSVASNGQVVVEAEHFKSKSAGPSDEYTFQTVGETGSNGAADPRGGLFMRSGPNNGTANTTGNPFDVGPVMSYDVLIEEAGTYRAWLRHALDPDTAQPAGNDDSIFIRVFEKGGAAGDFYLVDQFGSDWNWIGQGRKNSTGLGPAREDALFNLGTGVYTIQIAMREDGADLDAILLDLQDGVDQFTGGSQVGPAASAFRVSAIPEPTTAAFGLLAAGALLIRRRSA